MSTINDTARSYTPGNQPSGELRMPALTDPHDSKSCVCDECAWLERVVSARPVETRAVPLGRAARMMILERAAVVDRENEQLAEHNDRLLAEISNLRAINSHLGTTLDGVRGDNDRIAGLCGEQGNVIDRQGERIEDLEGVLAAEEAAHERLIESQRGNYENAIEGMGHEITALKARVKELADSLAEEMTRPRIFSAATSATLGPLDELTQTHILVLSDQEGEPLPSVMLSGRYLRDQLMDVLGIDEAHDLLGEPADEEGFREIHLGGGR